MCTAPNELGLLDVLTFDVEPDCWREHRDGLGAPRQLKPDAYARIGIGAYEDRYFIEVDLGSESMSVMTTKLKLYLDYFASGTEQAAHGVFPKVLLLTNGDKRKAKLLSLLDRLPAETWRLFAVDLLPNAYELLSHQGDADSAAEQEALS